MKAAGERNPAEGRRQDQVSDRVVEDLCQQVERLHRAGISHGRLNLSNVLVVEDGPMLVDLSWRAVRDRSDLDDIDFLEGASRHWHDIARRPLRSREGVLSDVVKRYRADY